MGVTNIEWTDYSFNPWWGCQRVSPGCENCYAETFAKRTGKSLWGPTAERRTFGDKHWNEPLKWNAKAVLDGVRRRVFCASMADVFEDRRELDAERKRLWTIIAATPHLDWQLLTKRPENIGRLGPMRLPSNVWLGTTAEDQTNYDRRWRALANAASNARGFNEPPLTTFISYEPALGPLTLKCNACGRGARAHVTEVLGCHWFPTWLIIGGESGARRRPFDIAWLTEAVADARRAGAAVFVKQDGAFRSGEQGRIPAELWLKEFPR